MQSRSAPGFLFLDEPGRNAQRQPPGRGAYRGGMDTDVLLANLAWGLIRDWRRRRNVDPAIRRAWVRLCFGVIRRARRGRAGGLIRGSSLTRSASADLSDFLAPACGGNQGRLKRLSAAVADPPNVNLERTSSQLRCEASQHTAERLHQRAVFLSPLQLTSSSVTVRPWKSHRNDGSPGSARGLWSPS